MVEKKVPSNFTVVSWLSRVQEISRHRSFEFSV